MASRRRAASPLRRLSLFLPCLWKIAATVEDTQNAKEITLDGKVDGNLAFKADQTDTGMEVVTRLSAREKIGQCHANRFDAGNISAGSRISAM
jgi:hypothetical protein